WYHTKSGKKGWNRRIIHPKFAVFGLAHLGAHLTSTFAPPLRLLDRSHAQERGPLSRLPPPACPADHPLSIIGIRLMAMSGCPIAQHAAWQRLGLCSAPAYVRTALGNRTGDHVCHGHQDTSVAPARGSTT